MALDRQIDFTGGLNTRIPAHKLPENMVQAAINTDFTHGDVRPDTGIGGDGGGKQFYYEKGGSWVGTDLANAYTILTIDAGVSTTEANPTTDLGNPLTISETGTYQVGVQLTFTTDYSTDNRLDTSGVHSLVVGDTIVLSGSDIPAPLVAGTTYFVKTQPSTTEITLSATAVSAEITLTDNGTGTHTLTSVASVIVNDTELNLGSVTSFVEYNDDLYMGRENFSLVATTLTVQTGLITLTAADVAKVIVSDSVVGTGIPLGAKIESIDYGTNIITLDKTISTGGSSVTLTINTAPARIIDGVLTKIFPLEIPKPKPLDVSVSQLTDTNAERAAGHSVKWVTDNFPIPLQWGIARFDDASGAEAGISELSPIVDSLANIDPSLINVPALVKYQIDSYDASSALYGKFALYRVGGTSTVIKKVQNVLLTSQRDGTPLSVAVARGTTTTHAEVQVAGLPTGAQWKVKWYGYGPTSHRRHYHSGAITKISINIAGSGYLVSPTVTIPAPAGTGVQATAYAVLTGDVVKNIVITEKGSGYDPLNPPSILLTAAPGGGTNATANNATVETGSYKGETTYFSDVSAVHALYGSHAHHHVDLHFIVKFTSDYINSVTGAPYSDDTREYLFASSNLADSTVSGDNGLGTHDGCGSIIDFTPPRALIEIEPINDPVSIPYNLKYLTEFNNFFMGAVDKRLHISNYAKPNNFAIDGYLDFDAQITGIISRGGEAVVFTEFGVYRVYGNAHNEMRKVEVPTVHGIPVGGHKTISKIKDSVIYASHTGICLFDGRSVTVLTDNVIQNFAKPSANVSDNVSGVIDNTYYLLSDGSDGWKVDLKHSPKISKSTGRATNFHYRGNSNKLFTEAGYIGGGTENKFSFQTRDFTGGNITAEKAYYTVYVTGTDFSGTVNIKCDGSLSDTFNFGSVIPEFNRALYLSTAKVANRASIEFVNCSGQITSVSIKYDIIAEQQKKRFNFVTLTYIGTPTVTVKVDSVQKIASIVLTSPGAGNTGTSILYFPAMTEGYIPHIIADETETSRISGSVFDAEVI